MIKQCNANMLILQNVILKNNLQWHPQQDNKYQNIHSNNKSWKCRWFHIRGLSSFKVLLKNILMMKLNTFCCSVVYLFLHFQYSLEIYSWNVFLFIASGMIFFSSSFFFFNPRSRFFWRDPVIYIRTIGWNQRIIYKKPMPDRWQDTRSVKCHRTGSVPGTMHLLFPCVPC